MHEVQFGEPSGQSSSSTPHSSSRINTILNTSLPGASQGSLWDVSILGSHIKSISPHDPTRLHHLDKHTAVINAHSALLAPALCHPHIHLDKPYLLSHPKYSHLQIQKGDFAEAMQLTNQAKANFEHNDLLDRGQRLIDESVAAGVTSMRAFVEVDPIVGIKCLDAGIALKEQSSHVCQVQLCAFAQLALFSTHDDHGEEMRSLVRSAAEHPNVDVVGSTPYVESNREMMHKNVEWTINLALANDKHLDFHLDYNLDSETGPLIWLVIRLLKAANWTAKTKRTIVFGHCTRLCLFSQSEWKKLRDEIADLPISFVGLPTSDLFMMRTENQSRGTLPIPAMIKHYNLNAAIGINNVGNAFTPQGCCDPLAVASMAVGVYQAGTVKDADILYECVSTRARAAIGLSYEHGKPAGSESSSSDQDALGLELLTTKETDLILFGKDAIDWRTRKSVSEAIYLYDGARGRRTIKDGVLID